MQHGCSTLSSKPAVAIKVPCSSLLDSLLQFLLHASFCLLLLLLWTCPDMESANNRTTTLPLHCGKHWILGIPFHFGNPSILPPDSAPDSASSFSGQPWTPLARGGRSYLIPPHPRMDSHHFPSLASAPLRVLLPNVIQRPSFCCLGSNVHLFWSTIVFSSKHSA